MIYRFFPRHALALFGFIFLPFAALQAQPVITLTYSAFSVELGQTASFTGVRVNGQTPLTYQWIEQGAGNTTIALHDGATANGSTLAGTTSIALSLTGTTAADAGAYAIEVTDANGYTTTSAWMSLTVKAAAAPTITNQPVNVTVIAGNSASFTIAATGSYPRTYQWYKGTPPSGSAISGATNYAFTITATAVADAGSYYAVISNAYGSSTSNAATLTVNPATPIAFSGSDSSQTTYVGQSVTLYKYPANGSTPITYQWQKNGTNISGATNNSYSINPAALSDSGTYTEVATNAAGSVTSPAITLTVNPAVPVAFPATVNPVTATAGQSLSLSMSVNAGSWPITYQWQKNGVAISGATGTSYYLNPATTADSGNYTLVGTNAAGSTTSPAIVVTVNPATPPTITTPPADVTAPLGYFTTFTASVGGSSPFTYQWLKNGTPITGATGASYTISTIQASDAASYSIKVTNVAGSVTSSAATLTVSPPVPPSFSGSVSQQTVNQGNSLTLSVPSQTNNQVVGPMTYQWFKNGTPISGATGYSYTISNAQFTDAGTYTANATNLGGTATMPPTEVVVTAPASSATAWIDAAQQGSIVYFVFSQHIERYDLSTATWLPSTSLTQTATAFCVAADGVYVGFGRALAKFPLDLSTQTTLANLSGSISGMFSFGGYVYAAVGSALYPVDRNTGAIGAAQSAYLNYRTPSFAVAPAANRIYTPDGSFGPYFMNADNTGALTAAFNSRYYGTFRFGDHAYLLPDQQHFADNGGTIFNVSDGTIAATFGSAFTDMAFLADGTPVVLRDSVLSTYAVRGMKETAHTTLSVAGSRVFVSGGNVFVFYPGTSSGNNYVGANEVTASSITGGYPVAPTVDASSLSFTPSATIQDNTGVVYLYDAAHENLYRWSPASRSYLAPIALAGAPKQLLYSSTLNAIFCVYQNSRITKIDLSAATPTEQPFSAFPDAVITATGADNFLFAILQDAQDSGEEEAVIDGRTGAITAFVGWSYFASGYTWSSVNQTLYPTQLSYGTTGSIQPITSTGTLPNPTLQFSQTPTGAIFPSSDGTRLGAAGGQIYDATGLYLGVLGNAVTEITFLGSTPYSIRSTSNENTEVQAWSPMNFVLSAATTLPGTPVRLLPLSGNQLLVVTQYGGVPTYTVINASLQRVSTTLSNGTTSGAPSFVAQPAASVSAYAGTNVTLAVDTNGATPQTFQWYKNGTAISGATTASLQLSSVTTADGANYYVIATNSAGSATSTTTTLSIAPALSFTAQPQSQTAAAGTSVTFQASVANATGASYQWYFNGTAISGATSNTLVISPVANPSSYGTYVLKVSNTAGAIYSTPATLGATTSAPVITAQPSSLVVSTGNSASFSVSGQNVTSYQWYAQGAPIAGATSGIYSIPVVAAANAGNYYVVLTGPGGSTTSNTVTLTVQSSGAAPTITAQPQSVTIALGGTATLTVSAANGFVFQWYFNGTTMPGATGSVLTVSNVTPANAGNYTVLVTGPGGSVTSNPATVTVGNPPPSISQQPQSATVAPGGSVSLIVTASNATSYQWFLNGTAVTGATSSVLALNNVTSTTAGTYTVVVAGAGGSVTSNAAIITLQTNASAGTYFGTTDGGGTWAIWVPPAGDAKFVVYLPQSHIALTGDLRLDANGAFTSWSINGDGDSGATYPTAITGQILSGIVTGNINNAGGNMTGSIDSGTSFPTLAGYYPVPALNGDAGSSYAVVGGSGKMLAIWFGVQGIGGQADAVSGVLSGDPEFSGTTLRGRKVTVSIEATTSAMTQTLAMSANSTVTFGGVPASTPNTARLLNLSARADVGTGTDVLITGFSIHGDSSQTKHILVRGVGPTMKIFSLSDPLADPQLTFNDGSGAKLWTGTSWGGSTALATTFTSVGAFPLDPTSADSAQSFTVNPGNYTAIVSGAANDTGIALAEIYDTDTGPTGARLVNLSARGNVQPGAGVLTAGLVIGGTGPETVLLRGIGPTMKILGISDYLASPQLTLYDSAQHPIATNTGWSDSGYTTNYLMSQVGAFQLPDGSADCVLRATLMPGSYTVQVTSRDGSTGVALVEVYEVR